MEKTTNLSTEDIGWIEGLWQLDGKEVYEEWKMQGEKITGSSFIESEGDTMILEYLSLEMINDTLYYIPTVLNQNEGKSIPFKSESKDSRHLKFVNMNHDFPQIIQYDLLGTDTIKVTLQGTPDEKNQFLLLRNG